MTATAVSGTTSFYIDGGLSQPYTVNAYATFNEGGVVSASIEHKTGIHPVLAFKYIKSKFGLMERMTIDRRLKRLEKAFLETVEGGQSALAEKLMREFSIEVRQSAMYAKGIRYYAERENIQKVKHKIKDGHISDTKFQDYTKTIPREVIRAKKEAEDCFDGFVIYHYYNKSLEDQVAKKQKMTSDEKAKMRDPILFGWIKECDRLYFVADWEDEFCDLTFDEMIGKIGEKKIEKYPVLNK